MSECAQFMSKKYKTLCPSIVAWKQRSRQLQWSPQERLCQRSEWAQCDVESSLPERNVPRFDVCCRSCQEASWVASRTAWLFL